MGMHASISKVHANFPDTRRVYISKCCKTYSFSKRLYCNSNDAWGYILTCYAVVNTRRKTFGTVSFPSIRSIPNFTPIWARHSVLVWRARDLRVIHGVDPAFALCALIRVCFYFLYPPGGMRKV